MEFVNNSLMRMYIIAACTVQRFKEEERGDTNFVSMLLIIGIAVVIAGLFLTLAKDTVMQRVGQAVTIFLGKLGI